MPHSAPPLLVLVTAALTACSTDTPADTVPTTTATTPLSVDALRKAPCTGLNADQTARLGLSQVKATGNGGPGTTCGDDASGCIDRFHAQAHTGSGGPPAGAVAPPLPWPAASALHRGRIAQETGGVILARCAQAGQGCGGDSGERFVVVVQAGAVVVHRQHSEQAAVVVEQRVGLDRTSGSERLLFRLAT